MKNLIYTILVFTLFFVSGIPAQAHLALPHAEIAEAQEATGLNFLIVSYDTLEDIDFLFQNSSRVLGYFEDIEGDPPFFLTLANDSQRQIIEDGSLKSTLIDENADISSYMLLYNHSIDQSDKLRPYVTQVHPLSSHYTLIKFDQDNFDPHQIPDAVEFGPVPFLEGISPPPSIQSPTKTPQESVPTNAVNSVLQIAIGAGIILFTILGVGIFVFVKKRKKSPPQDPIQDDQINQPIPPSPQG